MSAPKGNKFAKKPPELLRNKPVIIRLTIDEKKDVKGRAKACDKNTSNYIRGKILED